MITGIPDYTGALPIEYTVRCVRARRYLVFTGMEYIARLQKYTSEAADTLHEVMTNKSANDFARVGAAKAILDHATKAVEVEDLAARREKHKTVLPLPLCSSAP